MNDHHRFQQHAHLYFDEIPIPHTCNRNRLRSSSKNRNRAIFRSQTSRSQSLANNACDCQEATRCNAPLSKEADVLTSCTLAYMQMFRSHCETKRFRHLSMRLSFLFSLCTHAFVVHFCLFFASSLHLWTKVRAFYPITLHGKDERPRLATSSLDISPIRIRSSRVASCTSGIP